MRKALMITSCAAAISAFAATGAFAQTSTEGPTSAQTQSARPMTNDASKNGSPAAQGSMQKPGTTGMSNGKTMSNDTMKKDKMKKDGMSK